MDTTANKEVLDPFSKGLDAAWDAFTAPNLDDATAKEREQVAAKAAAKFAKLRDTPITGSNAYLDRKQVGAYGVKFDKQNLIVPVRDVDGKIWSLQTIFAESGGPKLFQKGGRKTGNMHIIGDIQEGGHLLVAEGYATAASLFEATGKPVVVAFDAGNLDPVVGSLKERFPTNKIFIMGDNDHTKDFNVGIEKGLAAAEKHNIGVGFPVFAAKGEQSDFNDLHVTEGLSKVKEQVDRIIQGYEIKVNRQEAAQPQVPAPAQEQASPELPKIDPPVAADDPVKIVDLHTQRQVKQRTEEEMEASTALQNFIGGPAGTPIDRAPLDARVAARQAAFAGIESMPIGSHMSYHRAGTEVFRDVGDKIALPKGAENIPANLEAALHLAAEKFGDKGIILHGTDTFKQQTMQVMAAKGIDIKFADKDQADEFEAVKLQAQKPVLKATPADPVDQAFAKAVHIPAADVMAKPVTYTVGSVTTQNKSFIDVREAAQAFHQLAATERPFAIKESNPNPEAFPNGVTRRVGDTTQVIENGKSRFEKVVGNTDKAFHDAYHEIGMTVAKRADPLQVQPIGSKMNQTEYDSALNKVGGPGIGRIYVPKQHCGYTGKIIQVSDTHIVQKISKHMAVAHDVTKIANGPEILKLAEQGKLRNAELNVNYNEKQAEAKQVVFNLQDANAIISNSQNWANEFIKLPQSREAFGKIVQDFAAARAQSQEFAKPAPVQVVRRPNPQPQPQPAQAQRR